MKSPIHVGSQSPAETTTSSVLAVTAGMLERIAFGPNLFLCYYNDMRLLPIISVALYADDVLFMALSIRLRQWRI
ncbi:hypothetical protein J6590_100519 [Homalodisca vitripennis]|nr:hypothetical protein J6590_100519 [Homalodisca vitripennis]